HDLCQNANSLILSHSKWHWCRRLTRGQLSGGTTPHSCPGRSAAWSRAMVVCVVGAGTVRCRPGTHRYSCSKLRWTPGLRRTTPRVAPARRGAGAGRSGCAGAAEGGKGPPRCGHVEQSELVAPPLPAPAIWRATLSFARDGRSRRPAAPRPFADRG